MHTQRYTTVAIMRKKRHAQPWCIQSLPTNSMCCTAAYALGNVWHAMYLTMVCQRGTIALSNNITRGGDGWVFGLPQCGDGLSQSGAGLKPPRRTLTQN